MLKQVPRRMLLGRIRHPVLDFCARIFCKRSQTYQPLYI